MEIAIGIIAIDEVGPVVVTVVVFGTDTNNANKDNSMMTATSGIA